MMINLQVPDATAAIELEEALLSELLEIQRQQEALKGQNTRLAMHRRDRLRARYMLCQAWKESVVRQTKSLFEV